MTSLRAPSGESRTHGSPVTTQWGVLREPWLWILLLALCVHIVRRNVVDIVVFAVAAVLIVADAWRTDKRETLWPRRVSPAAVTLGALAFAALSLPLARSGWALPVLLVVPGVLATYVVLRVGRSPLQDAVTAEEHPGPGLWWWPAVLVVGCLVELANFVLQPNPQTDSFAHPTLSALIDPLLASAPARAFVIVLWIAAGWWLVRTITVGRERER